MTTMYMAKTFGNGGDVELVTIDRKTDKSVWVNGRRESIYSKYHNYFDTFEEAHNHVIQHNQGLVAKAEGRLDYAKEGLKEAIKIQKPSNIPF